MSHFHIDGVSVSVLMTSDTCGDPAAALFLTQQQAHGEIIVLGDAPGIEHNGQLESWVRQLRLSPTDNAVLAVFADPEMQMHTTGSQAEATVPVKPKDALTRMFVSMDALMTQPAVLVFRRDALDPDALLRDMQKYAIRALLRPFVFLYLLNLPLIVARLPLRQNAGSTGPLMPGSSHDLALECASLFDFACHNGHLKDIRTYALAVRNLFNGVTEALPGVPLDSVPGQQLLRRAAELETILGKFSRMKPLFSAMADHTCPACQHKVIHFVPMSLAYIHSLAEHGYIYALNEHETFNVGQYYCPVCRATDYERLYALHLRSTIKEAGAEKHRLLHVGPSRAMTSFIADFGMFEQRTADLYVAEVDDCVDVADMHIYADEQFDCFICSMVLEHVEDDQAAMRELHRVLRPGGWGILMVPVVLSLSTIQESEQRTTEADRWTNHGHGEHVRTYSRQGFIDRVGQAGFEIETFGVDHFGADAFRLAGIGTASTLYRVTKPLQRPIAPAPL